jgi:geranylgeranyl pyrophosphate synthase
LADDLLDVAGDPALAGKTLGSDSARAKVTAAAAALNEPVDPPAVIRELCAISAARLVEWPAVQSAWQAYLDLDLRPPLTTT